MTCLHHLYLVGDIIREKGLAGETSARKEPMTGAGVVLSQVLGLVRPLEESDE